MKLLRRLFVASAAALAISLVSAACTDFSSPPAALGRVLVQVTDTTTNMGIGSIGVDLLLADRATRWRNIETKTDGTGEFGTQNGGVIPQTYIVRVLLSGEEYTLAPSETNDKPVTVIIGQTFTIKFKLQKRSAGGPGGA